ncbi:MAG: response regulator transcription factor [Bacteroidales bacterium]|nr:response regulator transcription factor [Bacteroidales bacterium]
MKAFVIEDEPMAQRNLTRLLEKHFPEIEVAGYAATVEEAVSWLQDHAPDLVFMDVQLSDGLSFDIFLQVDIACPVVITTAYDQYALQAFQKGSVDYLVKPIDLPDLRRAVARCLQRSGGEDAVRLLSALVESGIVREDEPYKKRLLVRVGDMIYPIKLSDVALVYSEHKSTFLLSSDGSRYLVNPSLDELGALLDPAQFFRVSRSCIVSREAVRGVMPIPGGRYSLEVAPSVPFEVEVSRGRSEDFYHWYRR